MGSSDNTNALLAYTFVDKLATGCAHALVCAQFVH